MATRVIIPASPDGLKPRAAPLEGLLDADGLGVDAVDEEPDEEEFVDETLVAAALVYRDWMSVTMEKSRDNRIKHTLKASIVSLEVGLTAKTMPALQ